MELPSSVRMQAKNTVIIATILILLCVITGLEVSERYTKRNQCDNFKTSEEKIPSNNTLCTFIKQFKLLYNKRITVCKYQNVLRVDIRQFVGDKASIKGIWLTLDEWRSLLRSQMWVNSALSTSE